MQGTRTPTGGWALWCPPVTDTERDAESHELRPRRRHRQAATRERRGRRREPVVHPARGAKALAARDIGTAYRLLKRDGMSQRPGPEPSRSDVLAAVRFGCRHNRRTGSGRRSACDRFLTVARGGLGGDPGDLVVDQFSGAALTVRGALCSSESLAWTPPPQRGRAQRRGDPFALLRSMLSIARNARTGSATSATRPTLSRRTGGRSRPRSRGSRPAPARWRP